MSRLVTLPKITEEQFQAQVIELAHLFGWKVAHFRPARTQRGWRTPCGADGEGYVDLTLVRERMIFVECKREGGKLSDEQECWRDWLIEAGQEWHCWTPADWREIETTLRRKEATR